MKRTFEDAIVDVQGKMVSLCLEALDIVKAKADMIGIYCYNEHGAIYFDAFFVQGNEAKQRHEVGIRWNLAREFQLAGIEYIEELVKVCKDYSRPAPTEMRLWYVPKTRRFKAEYKYDQVINIDIETKLSVDVFGEWMAQEQKQLDAGK